MKNKVFQIVLLMGLAIVMFSCTPRTLCGEVFGKSQSGDIYKLIVIDDEDGFKKPIRVTEGVYLSVDIGDSRCIH